MENHDNYLIAQLLNSTLVAQKIHHFQFCHCFTWQNLIKLEAKKSLIYNMLRDEPYMLAF